MAQQTIAVGSSANDGTGDTLRAAFQKVNSNCTDLYTLAHPGYVAGNWYIPLGVDAFTTGAAPGSGSIRLHGGFIGQKVTLNTLGVRISTAQAGGNVQAAIYANNPATCRPTGNALASTASMSTASTGVVNAAVSVQLDVGYYWFATNMDNGTSGCYAFSGLDPLMNQIVGSATQGDVLAGAGGTLSGLSVVQTFGSWPDLTSASFSDIIAGTNVPVVAFKIASVP